MPADTLADLIGQLHIPSLLIGFFLSAVGMFSLLLFGQYLSGPSSVGFITLFKHPGYTKPKIIFFAVITVCKIKVSSFEAA